MDKWLFEPTRDEMAGMLRPLFAPQLAAADVDMLLDAFPAQVGSLGWGVLSHLSFPVAILQLCCLRQSWMPCRMAPPALLEPATHLTSQLQTDLFRHKAPPPTLLTQPMDFFGAIRSRLVDDAVRRWLSEEAGDSEVRARDMLSCGAGCLT